MTVCYACGTVLTGDSFNGEPPTYQFDNALWIGFHGGYGMFVDNLEATLPVNTDDRWLRDDTGAYITQPDLDWGERPIEDLNWRPEYREERMLDGADYEAVICHECAHLLCDTVPWIAKLLTPHNSHAHRTAWKEAHPEHDGWDYTGVR